MCSIIASFSKEKLLELVDLNSYRGNLNSSITYFDRSNESLKISQRYGPIEIGLIDPPEGAFTVIHQQAPTGDNVRDNKNQPAKYLDPNIIDWCYLWHNGILKEHAVSDLQTQLDNPVEGWDTQLLLEMLVKHEFEYLSEIDGSFACILFMRGNFYVFRNELAPLFVDQELTFSSTEFPGSVPVVANKVWRLDLKMKLGINIYKFKTKNNPYKFEENQFMAWWDHEELKSPSDRSDRYKVSFPDIYSETEVLEAKARLNNEEKPKAVDAYSDYIRVRLDAEAEAVAAAEELAEQVKKSPESPSLPTDQKFGEAKYIDEITEYLASTYSAHYAKGKVQAFELVDSAGLADGFTMGSVIKYASRYGKKNGYNRKDLLKIIHYALLQLWVHDKNGYDDRPKT